MDTKSTSSMSELNLKIKPLDGTNYPTWSKKLTQVLKQQGLWQLAQGLHVEENVQKKKLLEDKAVGLISFYVADSINLPPDKDTAEQLWDYLKNLFEPKDMWRCVMLNKKFHKIEMLPEESIATFIDRVESVATELKNVNEPLSDKQIMWQILGGLTSSYDSLVMAFCAANDKDKVTLSQVKQTLYFEQSRKYIARDIERHKVLKP